MSRARLVARRLEPHQAGLLRMNGELKARKPLWPDHQHPTRLVLPLAANDTIIGTAEQNAAPLQPWLDLLLKPLIQHVIQQRVRPHGGTHAPLRAAQGVPL